MMVKAETAGGAVSSTRVLVAGASIAGPALAHWLRRRGAEVTVVERAPELRPGGQAVDARGVAREVVRLMGLDEAVRAARTPWTWTGTCWRPSAPTTTAVTATSRRSRSCAGTCPGCCTTTPATVSS